MEKILTEINGPVILRPKVFTDARGYFFESYTAREFNRLVGPVDFVQENESRSVRGVMRGLHFQRPPFAQAKLLRCTRGAMLDIALDLRLGSPTYGRHIAVELSEQNKLQLYIPRGFAHGYIVLSDVAVCQYKCDEFYHPEAEGGISILDPALGINIPPLGSDIILSDKDRNHPLLSQFTSPFSYEP